jgi:hypothetical protein
MFHIRKPKVGAFMQIMVLTDFSSNHFFLLIFGNNYGLDADYISLLIS